MKDKYELKVLKSAASKLIDELIENSKNNLDDLKIRREEIVFDVARKIYTQSGRKIPFSEIRDLLDSRIEIKKHLTLERNGQQQLHNSHLFMTVK